MSCPACENEPIRGMYYRFENANVEIVACREHAAALMDALRDALDAERGEPAALESIVEPPPAPSIVDVLEWRQRDNKVVRQIRSLYTGGTGVVIGRDVVLVHTGPTAIVFPLRNLVRMEFVGDDAERAARRLRRTGTLG